MESEAKLRETFFFSPPATSKTHRVHRGRRFDTSRRCFHHPATCFQWELGARGRPGLTCLFADSRTSPLRIASSRFATHRTAADMPERISISDFVVLTNEDLSSPGTSSFQSKMSDCRSTVWTVEEVRAARGGRRPADTQTHQQRETQTH